MVGEWNAIYADAKERGEIINILDRLCPILTT
jgi:hypothetical protein